MTIGHEPTIVDNILFAMCIGAVILLGVAMAQPIWRGQEMLDQMRSNCAKIDGIMIETKGMFGTTYECYKK